MEIYLSNNIDDEGQLVLLSVAWLEQNRLVTLIELLIYQHCHCNVRSLPQVESNTLKI